MQPAGRSRGRGGCVTFRGMCRAFLVASLVLAACGSRTSTGPGTQAAGAGSGSDMECHEETSTGSSISHQVCRSKFDADQDRKGAQDFMSTPRAAPGQPPS